MSYLHVSTTALAGPLLLRRSTDSDFTVEIAAGEIGRLAAGRILMVARSGGVSRWLWSLTAPAAPDAGIGLHGEAETLPEAQEAFRLAFDQVLAWAAAEPGGKVA